MYLDELVKNKYTVSAIKEMIKSGRISGTFIFEGAAGSGKSSVAKMLAKAIVCEDGEYKKIYGEACGVCSSCKKADMNIHPDVTVSEPDEEKADSFHIDKVREIIDNLYLSPNDSDVKVYILEDLQNMTVQAQNALLKSIEEPPHFAVFIITVTNRDLILETVVSRAVTFTMEYIDGEAMLEYFKSRPLEFNFDSEEIKKAVKFSNGSIGGAIKILRDETSVYDNMSGQIKNILYGRAKNIKSYILTALLQFMNGNYTRTELLNFYLALETAARDILTAKVFMSNRSDEDIAGMMAYFDDFESVGELANLYSTEKLFELLQNIHDFKSNLDYNINTKLNIAGFLSQTCESRK